MTYSVVIPLYNKEKHIKRAIKSVLRQTYQQFEIIVVDDGSVDNSYQETKNIQDTRLKVYKKSNRGVSSARNYGIMQSSYEYIAFLDADDEWEPDFLESIHKLVQQFPHAGAYGTAYKFVKYDGAEVIRHPVKNMSEGEMALINYFLESLDSPVLTASSVVIHKEVFNRLGVFLEDITRGEDLDMWRRIALEYDVAFINNICVTYFLNASNQATKKDVDYNKSSMKYVEKLLENEKRKGNGNSDYKEYLISKVINKARYLIRLNQSAEARKLLLKYKHTKYNKKKWGKTYILTFRPLYALYKSLR